MTDDLLGSAGEHEQEPLETTARAAAMRPSFSLESSILQSQTGRNEEIDRLCTAHLLQWSTEQFDRWGTDTPNANEPGVSQAPNGASATREERSEQ